MSEAGNQKSEEEAGGRIASGFRLLVSAFRRYRASFLFKEELQGWPVVRHAAPGVFIVKAPHIGPRRVQKFSGWKPPVLTGAALGFLNCLRFGLSAKQEDLAWVFAGAAIYGGLLSIPFWRLARKTRLKIRFIDGSMIWRGPDLRKHVVKPEEPRSMQGIPHRWGPQEARNQTDWMRSNPGRAAPEPLFQTASELILHTGPGGSDWRTVAEFCNDETRQQAHRLLEAIELVTAGVKEELAARRREAAA